MVINMDSKINAWKNKLLDLGKRNHLISFHQTKRSTLIIKKPEIFELWDALVKNESTLSFPFLDDTESDAETAESLFGPEFDIVNGDIETNQSLQDMLKTLRNLRNKSKTSIEERGVNILYLAFGFLEWTETGYSKDTIASPLILVPVDLSIESIDSPYQLSLADDEIVLNPALRYKMENDFGIILPDFDIENDVEAYFQSVTDLIRFNKWKVNPEASLGVFSFLKMNMYTDLENNRELISCNPTVRTICGDITTAEHIPPELVEYDFDKQLRPSDAFQVVDADSSQQEAILCARKGISFVLQGPPGTGKSQTITNIIAECLADGKKVLFVSEKMAALDVVYRRLTAAQLSDFCLVLHSHKANKKAVLDQLRISLNLAKTKASLSDEAYMKLDALYQDREKLNLYAEQVFTEIEPFGKSIYWVNGLLAELIDYDDLIFPIKDIRKTTFATYNRYIYVLNNFVNTIGRLSEDYSSNPWYGAAVNAVTNELRHDISARFPLLGDSIRDTFEKTSEIFKNLSLAFPVTYHNIEQAVIIFDFVKNAPEIPYSWVTADRLDVLETKIPDLLIIQDRYHQRIEKLQEICNNVNKSTICAIDVPEFTDLNDLETIARKEAEVEACLNSNPIFSRLKLANNYQTSKAERKNIDLDIAEIRDTVAKISQDFTDAIFTIDYKSILSALKDTYDVFIRELRKGHSTSIVLLAQSKKLIPESWLTTENLLSVMEDIEYRQKKREEYLELSKNLKEIYANILKAHKYSVSAIAQLSTIQALQDEKARLMDIIAADTAFSYIVENKCFEQCQHERKLAEEKVGKIQELKSIILQDFDNGIFSIDYKPILGRYKVEYTSIFKALKSSYRSDSQKIKALSKNPSQKLPANVIISALTQLQQIDELKADINSRCPSFIGAFRQSFSYEMTDFEMIDYTLDLFFNIEQAISTISAMEDIMADFAPDDENANHRYGLLYKGFETSWADINLTLQWFSNFRLQISKIMEEKVIPYKEVGKIPSTKLFVDTLLYLQKIDHDRSHLLEAYPCLAAVLEDEFRYENTNFEVVDLIFQTYEQLQNCLTELSHLKTIMLEQSSQDTVLEQAYGFLYQGMNTSWSIVRQSLAWTSQFREIISNYNLNTEFVQRICSDHNTVEACGQYKDQLCAMLDLLAEHNFAWAQSLFKNSDELTAMNMQKLSERLRLCVNGLFLLEEWIDFTNARAECEKEGLAEYISRVESTHLAPHKIIPVFQKRFFRLWLDAILPEYPAVLNFRRLNQENTIHEFAELDKMQFEIAKARIKSKLINDLPLLDKFTSGLDEMGILKRELAKQRRIMPIRKLFREIPNLLLTLKPCLMMSPLSVSVFLEADAYQFDTVIFDEASQVCTENAIGAIFRGKQVIIAGDSKQLPPTNFFASSSSDSDSDYDRDDEEDTSADDYESILDEANLLPERTLLWHYRSRHEHLIAFSNTKIYHNNLITFPSSIDTAPDLGVEYVYVGNGVYDRGGKSGNVIEAEKVADLVFEHFKKYPHRSLGVITFGEIQQQAVETVIRKRRMMNRGYEHFFKEDKEEPFFIKNLENVQGDERDTIIFSIGYAKDASGVFRMNFGPLSKSGGERRLNVAITRAKYNVKLVGSILPTDIDLDRINSEGPQLLRAYIDFAINGIQALQREVTESDVVQHDSPFEKAVYDFLDRKGYKLATQVGCSGYRIDMAVKHPTISGQYVLGIECDGAAYHSARTARERDRLRQDVLENMGWKIYRIWSTDWIKDPITEGERLINAIEDALKDYGTNEMESPLPIEHSSSEFMSVKRKEVSASELDNPYGFAKMKDVTFRGLPLDAEGELSGADCIERIIDTLYPVHYDIICREMVPLYGQTKISATVKQEVDYNLQNMKNRIIRKGNFFYPIGDHQILPKSHNERKIDQVSIEELAAAMYVVSEKSVGFTKEILCAETAHAYNYKRMTQAVTIAMNDAFELLLKHGKIQVIEGKVEINK